MAKAPNYTAEMVERITAEYEAGVDVHEIAENVGRSFRSVVAKLTHLGVYVKPEKAPAAPKPEGPTKAEMLVTLAEVAPAVDTEGLEGATKAAIQSVIDALTAEPEAE